MQLDGDTCYRAMRARDPRFDGTFFVGVSTTGVYCRPICPARLPGRDRCSFYARAAEAERAGYRACFRCRPELAPGGASVDAVGRLVRAAVSRIEAGCLQDGSVESLAGELGVTPRHLRRAMEAELGVSPIELAQSRRLALAKQLLHDTRLPLTEVAFASGFSSVRRFNALFRERFGRPPGSLRRAAADPHGTADTITLRLDYRPPLDWSSLLAFFEQRAIPSVEHIDGTTYRRALRAGGRSGVISVAPAPDRSALVARVSLELAPALPAVVAKLRALFDLDARPDVVAAHLGSDPILAPSVEARPGLRVAGAADGFELVVRAILGQRISVSAARTLATRLVDTFGDQLPTESEDASALRLFPTASRLASLTEADLGRIGIGGPASRPLLAVARAVDAGDLDLDAISDNDVTVSNLLGVPGIGPWTVSYVALRALRDPDAFPAGDLVLRRVMGVSTERAAEERSRPWSPWRGYAAFHLWFSSKGTSR
jgi:AraC family transcriptional regulator, regulatory protein of adaptative response / DNA-3-methyladenine glycosylase II